jgi:hypothetical protein
MRRASNLLGKQMLLARRLVEAGAGFVTVSDCELGYARRRQQPCKDGRTTVNGQAE